MSSIRRLGRAWHWKAAILSAICRAGVFFGTNVPEGLAPGSRAMAVEFVFRLAMSGVLGSLTQAFSRATPRWAATVTALVLLPVLGHTAEFFVHSAAGTPRLAASLAASVAFSVVSTLFNLFAMRQGVLLVGAGQNSFVSDLRRLPGVIVKFVGAGCALVAFGARGLIERGGGWRSRRCT